MAILNDRRKPFAKTAWTSEQIDYAESGRQIRLLPNFNLSMYTR